MEDPKPLVVRATARLDVDAALAWYAQQAGEELMTRFVAALEAAYTHIAAYPGSGSPRWSQALKVPGLRFWRLTRFPYLMFYVEKDDEVHVVRVLHGARDIPSTLAEADSDDPP